MKKTKKSKSPIEKPAFTLTMRHGSEEYTASGATILEVLEKIKQPPKIVDKTFIKLTNGSRKLETMYFPMQARRMFYPLTRSLISKQFSLLLK